MAENLIKIYKLKHFHEFPHEESREFLILKVGKIKQKVFSLSCQTVFVDMDKEKEKKSKT